jgi:hypothetical protein
MANRNLTVEPRSITLGEVSVNAVIRSESSPQRWQVIVVLSRAPNLPAVQGDEVEAQLFDACGTPLRLVERPQGDLVEVGSSLGTSVNAGFRFQDSGTTLARLLVHYQGNTARFRVVSVEIQ